MDRESHLKDIVSESSWCMAALVEARRLQLPDWCIGAGAIRNLVWDRLHGFDTPSPLSDLDLAFFDAGELSRQRDLDLQARLAPQPIAPWEVTNQAGVHVWFETHFGHPVTPLQSLEEAVASWPEYATSVGVRLRANGELEVIAPHGLDDLFGIVVRRNPARVAVETYRQRVAAKRYAERWPLVRVVL